MGDAEAEEGGRGEHISLCMSRGLPALGRGILSTP